MKWMDGCACAPVTSRGKGNHCKSHWAPHAPFWQNRRFFSLFLSISPRPPCVHTQNRQAPTDRHLPDLFPSADIHSKHLSPLSPPEFKLNINTFLSKNLIHRSGFFALLDRRSGNEDRFHVFLSDLDWNSVCLRWGDFYSECKSFERTAFFLWKERSSDCLHWLQVNNWSELFYFEDQSFIRVKL